MTRTVGIVLVAAAVGICVLGVALFGAGLAQGNLQAAGAILGFAVLVIVLVGPLAAAGIFVITRARREVAVESEAEMQRKILDMVKTRGQVNVSDIIIETETGLPAVQDMIYKLVGMGVFSGYVNWDQGTLYSAEASALRDLDECRNCGGQVSLAGKGVLRCPFCGTEYFLT